MNARARIGTVLPIAIKGRQAPPPPLPDEVVTLIKDRLPTLKAGGKAIASN